MKKILLRYSGDRRKFRWKSIRKKGVHRPFYPDILRKGVDLAHAVKHCAIRHLAADPLYKHELIAGLVG